MIFHMLLTPKRWKYRKQHVKHISGMAIRGAAVSFGEYGLKAIDSAYVTSRQIEAARKVIVRYTKKFGKMRIRMFPDVPLTKKWLEMPMGKGKGDVEKYAARVKRGRIMFEVSWLDEETSKKALINAAKKLPVRVTVISKWEIR